MPIFLSAWLVEHLNIRINRVEKSRISIASVPVAGVEVAGVAVAGVAAASVAVAGVAVAGVEVASVAVAGVAVAGVVVAGVEVAGVAVASVAVAGVVVAGVEVAGVVVAGVEVAGVVVAGVEVAGVAVAGVAVAGVAVFTKYWEDFLYQPNAGTYFFFNHARISVRCTAFNLALKYAAILFVPHIPVLGYMVSLVTFFNVFDFRRPFTGFSSFWQIWRPVKISAVTGLVVFADYFVVGHLPFLLFDFSSKPGGHLQPGTRAHDAWMLCREDCFYTHPHS